MAGKAGGGGRWFCAHANFLQSLSSKLPHPGRWLEAKEPSLSSPSQQISHRAEQPRTHMVGGLSSNRKEAVVVGRARAPAPEMRPCPGSLGESGQVISPLPPPETVPWRSHVRPCGGGEACVNLGKCFDVWVGTTYPLRVPNTGLQNRLVSEGHTLMSGHKWDKWAGSDRAEGMARRGLECLCEAAWRDGERHTETGSVRTRQMLWPPFTDELAETHRYD